MTKKDFELLANALARVEHHIEITADDESQRDQDRALLAFTVDTIAARIGETHPRFKPGLFNIAALPLKNEALKQEILAKLGN